jgi:hypothetical protein
MISSVSRYSNGSASAIVKYVAAFLPEAHSGFDGQGLWNARAIAFLEAVTPPLVFIRDEYGIPLDVDLYRSFFEMARIEELAWKGEEKYPGIDHVLDPLKTYLINLPGYDRTKFGKQDGQAYWTITHHDLITLQVGPDIRGEATMNYKLPSIPFLRRRPEWVRVRRKGWFNSRHLAIEYHTPTSTGVALVALTDYLGGAFVARESTVSLERSGSSRAIAAFSSARAAQAAIRRITDAIAPSPWRWPLRFAAVALVYAVLTTPSGENRPGLASAPLPRGVQELKVPPQPPAPLLPQTNSDPFGLQLVPRQP